MGDRLPPVSQLDAEVAGLVEKHGAASVQQSVRRAIKAAPPLKRRRGRPPGPQYDDTRSEQAAAALWRQAGRPPRVWRELVQAGGSEAVARRLLYRLAEWGEEGCRERHIADFYDALCTASARRNFHKLAQEVAKEAEGTTPEARRVITFIFEMIARELAQYDHVRVPGFGSFYAGSEGWIEFELEP
jgi:Bacterial DNA-binding protein